MADTIKYMKKLRKNWNKISEVKEYIFVFNDKYDGANRPEKSIAELRKKRDLEVEHQAGFNGVLNHFFIENGQCAGHTEADGADIGIGLVAEMVAAAAEDFSFSTELDMNFQAYNGFKFRHSF